MPKFIFGKQAGFNQDIDKQGKANGHIQGTLKYMKLKSHTTGLAIFWLNTTRFDSFSLPAKKPDRR